jgi:nucleoid DNA-binding protein
MTPNTVNQVYAIMHQLTEGDRVRILNFAVFLLECRQGKYARRRQALRKRLNKIPSEG